MHRALSPHVLGTCVHMYMRLWCQVTAALSQNPSGGY